MQGCRVQGSGFSGSGLGFKVLGFANVRYRNLWRKEKRLPTFLPVTFFKSSTVGCSELAKVQKDLYGNKLRMFRKTFSFLCERK